eukprot:1139018-Pelagomonas_calceolata.AAC.3
MPLCGEPDSALDIISGCKHSIMPSMQPSVTTLPMDFFLEGVRKNPLGTGLASMSIDSTDRLASQFLQIPENSPNRSLPIM